jgi:hypothetical protein
VFFAGIDGHLSRFTLERKSVVEECPGGFGDQPEAPRPVTVLIL